MLGARDQPGARSAACSSCHTPPRTTRVTVGRRPPPRSPGTRGGLGLHPGPRGQTPVRLSRCPEAEHHAWPLAPWGHWTCMALPQGGARGCPLLCGLRPPNQGCRPRGAWFHGASPAVSSASRGLVSRRLPSPADLTRQVTGTGPLFPPVGFRFAWPCADDIHLRLPYMRPCSPRESGHTGQPMSHSQCPTASLFLLGLRTLTAIFQPGDRGWEGSWLA